MPVRIKICGITRAEDALAAARAGADAIGLVFYASSPRSVSVPQAKSIMEQLPPFVSAVGLFVDAEPDYVRSVLDGVPLDLLQFHGDESRDFCASHGRRYVKAVRMRDGIDLRETAAQYPDAAGLLLDTYRSDKPGGTGETFQWNLVTAGLPLPVILAGGLTPANVGQAIEAVRPDAVDVSGGVEKDKGIKDAGKIADFISAVSVAVDKLSA